MSDLQFGSFQVSNVFIGAESLILGCFWVGFLALTLPKCNPSLHGGSSLNMFAEVADNAILLIYSSVKAVRYIT